MDYHDQPPANRDPSSDEPRQQAEHLGEEEQIEQDRGDEVARPIGLRHWRQL